MKWTTCCIGATLAIAGAAKAEPADETILCEAFTAPDGLLIRFRSYGDGTVVNRYGVAIYTPGDDLLRLRTTPGAAPLTEWLKLRPDEQSTRPAVRFRRV